VKNNSQNRRKIFANHISDTRQTQRIKNSSNTIIKGQISFYKKGISVAIFSEMLYK
jgi:hypothetical protein